MERDVCVSGARSGTTLKDVSVAAFLGSFFLFALSWTPADNDLWGHLRFGLDILESGRIAREDPYSYLTRGQVWVNHEWLAETAFAAAYTLAGPPGLVVLKVALGLTVVLLAYGSLGRQGVGPLGAALIVTYLTLPLVPWMIVVRPQLFTYLNFVLLLRWMELVERGRSPWQWGLILLFAAWANLHGGVLAGAGLLLLWATVRLGLPRLGNRSEPGDGRLAVIVLLSVLATLVNPYGMRLWIFLRTALEPRAEIVEWKPVELASVEGAFFTILMTAAIGGLLAVPRGRRGRLAVPLVLTTALLPLLSRRHTPFLALATMVLLGRPLADAVARLWRARFPETGVSSHRHWRIGAVLLLGPALVLTAMSLPRLRYIKVFDHFPVRAVALLKASAVTGNLAVEFNWGEYVLWHLGPALRVSMDGRRETVYSREVYREAMRFLEGVGAWDDLLKRPETDLVLVGRTVPTFNLLRLSAGWRLVYEDNLGGVFAREDSALGERIRQTPLPPENPPLMNFP